MNLSTNCRDPNQCIFGYTNREPTRDERRRRNKEPLTVKQKAVFRAIRKHIAEHGKGPKKSEVIRAMGHRSSETTNGYLVILARRTGFCIPEEDCRLN